MDRRCEVCQTFDMPKLRLLDLYCGAGGCAMGYYQAAKDIGVSLEILGVDIIDQPRYPFDFQKGLSKDAMFIAGNSGLFTHIHASPPCQFFTNNSNEKKKIGVNSGAELFDIRVMMYESKIPGVVENVPGSPLIKDIELEGRMFGLKVIRRRVFETVNWFMLKPGVSIGKRGQVKNGELMCIAGHGSTKNRWGVEYKVTGRTVLQKRSNAMGIDWMSVAELSQAIPPAYTRYIGQEFLKVGIKNRYHELK